VTAPLHEHGDATLQRLRNSPSVFLSAARAGQTLPLGLHVQLPVAQLLDAALGVRDTWNHGVLLRAIDQFDLQRPSRAWLYPLLPSRHAHRGDCGTDYGIWLTGDATLLSVISADCGDAGYDQTMPQRTATAAAAARVLTLSLVKRFATWVWTVRVPM
jgi:hypothetical protein